MTSPKIYLARLFEKLSLLFGRRQIVTISVILLTALVISVVILIYLDSTAPNTIIISSGPKGSSFQNNAEKYQKILAKQGVTLKIIPSEGSMDNLQNLMNPKVKVDVGFVLGGEVKELKIDNLVSLGSISYQPLMIFYHGKTKNFLSDFKGKRLDIGEDGSGTHSLALTLLKENGIEPNDGTTFVESIKGDSVTALEENRIDALFIMGDSTSRDVMHRLLHTQDIRLFNFSQADGYTRRIHYLNKLELPKGSLDFGKNIPSEDLFLIGPTVELIARDGLHPALSDLLLEAVREVHSTPGLFKNRGEFPAAQEHEFPLSADASRYYTSGKSFLYRTFPYGIASLIARLLSVIVPVALLLIPALKLAPAFYRWQMEYRIKSWYRTLFDIERNAFKYWNDPSKREELVQRLDQIEKSVSRIVVPSKFGDLVYGLRGHIEFVRTRLLAQSESRFESNPAVIVEGK
jgi:TRAP-type uncharacterized transport system substrate-binding protein